MVDEKEVIESVTIPVKWHDPADLDTLHANQMRVVHSQDEFYISFYELVPPFVTDPASLKKILEMEGGIRATCVARIALPASRMAAIVEALVQNLANYDAKQSKPDPSKES